MLCLEPINKIFGIMKYLKHRENISMNNKHLCFHHLDLTNVDILTYLPPVLLFLLSEKCNATYTMEFHSLTHSPPCSLSAQCFPEVGMYPPPTHLDIFIIYE